MHCPSGPQPLKGPSFPIWVEAKVGAAELLLWQHLQCLRITGRTVGFPGLLCAAGRCASCSAPQGQAKFHSVELVCPPVLTTHVVTSSGATVKRDWLLRLGDHLRDMLQSFCVYHWGPHLLCRSDYGNGTGEGSYLWHWYLHCPMFTAPCYGNSRQWQLEVRVHCGNSIWSEENTVWQLWVSTLVMLRAAVSVFDSTASSHSPWVRRRQGRFLFGVPLRLAQAQHPAVRPGLVMLWEAEDRPQTEDVTCRLLGWVCSAETCLSHTG